MIERRDEIAKELEDAFPERHDLLPLFQRIRMTIIKGVSNGLAGLPDAKMEASKEKLLANDLEGFIKLIRSYNVINEKLIVEYASEMREFSTKNTDH